jgi:hypothetical protein
MSKPTEEELRKLEALQREYRSNIDPKQLNVLKNELAVRENNEHVSVTKLGGNPTELFVLLHNKVKLEYTDGPEQPSYFKKTPEGITLFLVKESDSVRNLRPALTKFVQENYPNLNVSFAQLSNLSWLRDNMSNNTEWKLLIKAVEQANRLRELLEIKAPVRTVIDKMFDLEYQFIKDGFAKDFELATEDMESSGVENLIKNHPYWGLRYKDYSRRSKRMNESLLGNEEKEIMKMIDASTPAVCTIALRMIIQLERIVSWNLDDLMPFANKRITSGDKRSPERQDEGDSDIDEDSSED